MKIDTYARSLRGARHSEGMFTNSNNEEGEYRKCTILGREILVWGADGIRCLSKEVVGSLRSIIKRAPSGLPIALMADYHPAEVGVVGSIVASESHIVPDLIGSDCGCGVTAVATGISAALLDSEKRKQLYTMTVATIPVGSAQHAEVGEHVRGLPLWDRLAALPFVSERDLRRLRYQLGTLGGGNHFIEVATDPDDQLWVVVHTGSRYLGGLLQKFYQGRSLVVHSEEAVEFGIQQEALLEFAKESRKEIAVSVLACLGRLTESAPHQEGEAIDVPHNYIELGIQHSVKMALHRKGACSAALGQVGIICGSMLTGSYVVEGRGSAAGYQSSSHGAGRVCSRGDAFRSLSARDLRKDMAGVVWSGSERLKDEAPRAYKDLDTVMRSQKDLVRVRHHLKPVISVKGEG